MQLLVELAPLVAIVIFFTLVGAAILRSACRLYNRAARGKDRAKAVPEPDFDKAILICFVAMSIQVGVWVGFQITGITARLGQSTPKWISTAVGFLVNAGMIVTILPTTFKRGILVSLLQYALAISLLVILAVTISLLHGGKVPLLR